MRARERRSGARQLASPDLWAPKAANPDWVDANARARINEGFDFRDWMIRNVPANSLDAPTQ
jgi:hypothetical protein